MADIAKVDILVTNDARINIICWVRSKSGESVQILPSEVQSLQEPRRSTPGLKLIFMHEELVRVIGLLK